MSHLFSHDQLSTEERTFLRHHDIDASNLFDARSYPVTGWGDEAKKLNIQYGVGRPCKLGHRIRARSGHCIVCSTKAIGYLKKETQPGYVYIASSRAGRIHKVGSTVDYRDRQVRLPREATGGFDDWVIIAWFESREAQREERRLQGLLSEYKYAATTQKSTGLVNARELFGPDLRPIFSEFKGMIASRKPKPNVWLHPQIVEFDFKPSGT